jgi:3-isopropylmalate/(R)-2-methylmalate dehydratase large subunit
MGMTMIEKILARAAGREQVQAGDTVVCRVDMNILIDLQFTRWVEPLKIADLCVPRTSSTSRDQAVFADHGTDASLPPDAVLIKIDRFGQRFQRCRSER